MGNYSGGGKPMTDEQLMIDAKRCAQAWMRHVTPLTDHALDIAKARFADEHPSLGPDWVFTRGEVLAARAQDVRRLVHSVAGFDVQEPFWEKYKVYEGIYAYVDHRGRLHFHRTPRNAPTQGCVGPLPHCLFLPRGYRHEGGSRYGSAGLARSVHPSGRFRLRGGAIARPACSSLPVAAV